MLATMTVLALPPSESCSSLVSWESRYGMWLWWPSTSADITLPRAERDRLILVASLNLSPCGGDGGGWGREREGGGGEGNSALRL